MWYRNFCAIKNVSHIIYLSSNFTDNNPRPSPPANPTPPTNPPPPGGPISNPTPATPTPATPEPIRPTPSTIAPSIAPEGTKVGVPPFGIEYTITNAKLPSTREFAAVVSLTNVYLAGVFDGFFELTDRTDLNAIRSVYESAEYAFMQPISIDYSANAWFSDESIVVPTSQQLNTILEGAFAGQQGSTYAELLTNLPDNIFSGTTSVTLVISPVAGSGDTSNLFRSTGSFATMISASAAFVIIASILLIRKRRRKQSEGGQDRGGKPINDIQALDESGDDETSALGSLTSGPFDEHSVVGSFVMPAATQKFSTVYETANESQGEPEANEQVRGEQSDIAHNVSYRSSACQHAEEEALNYFNSCDVQEQEIYGMTTDSKAPDEEQKSLINIDI